MTFDKRMIRFTTAAVFITSAVVILISSYLAVMSLMAKSAQMVQNESRVVALSSSDRFKQYYDLVWAIAVDSHVQTYLKNSPFNFPNISATNDVLDNTHNSWSNINFITIIREDSKGYLAKGVNVPNFIPRFWDKLKDDYENSVYMGRGAMRMAYTKEYTANGRYTLNIYFPLYSSVKIGERLGLLCINADEHILSQLIEAENDDTELNIDTVLVHGSGLVISAKNPDLIHRQFPDSNFRETNLASELRFSKNFLMNPKIVFDSWPNLRFVQKLDRWNFYYISTISWWDLAKDSIFNILILTFVLFCLILCIIPLARRLIIKAYAPWNDVVKAMDTVSKGGFDIRLPAKVYDADMAVVADGFNIMVEQIIMLLDKVKEDQKQLDQIRFNALQAQIQPHFLYNTMECIHWQAAAEGNKTVSSMVLALAAYYRMCLSEGKDIITLKEETECIRHYLFIQKARYGEVLDYEIDVADDIMKVEIPKLTLQPLVENAIYHGIKCKENQKGKIWIGAQILDRKIIITVTDNGGGITMERIDQINQMLLEQDVLFGYGVRNVHRRLRLLFGEEFGLLYKKNDLGGVSVDVCLPR